MRQKIAATLFLCCLFLLGEAQILVRPGGTGNGKSWQQAMDLQSALSSANSGAEIWLKSGTYTPTQCSPCTEEDRRKSIVIPEGVKLLGGFSGIETQKNQRNWNQNLTILSGDIDDDGTLDNNSYTVVSTENVSSSTLVDGLIIRGGNASGSEETLEVPSRSGGGWYNGTFGTPQSNPIIRNCIFENNQASGFGGALYNIGNFDGEALPTIENCIFRNNSVQFDGGAIYNNGSFNGNTDCIISNCLFEDNTAGWEVGGGAGIFNNGITGSSSPLITNCIFIRQFATLHGGAIYNQGKSGNSNPVITNCVFYKNEAVQGAGIFNLGAFPDGNSSPIVINSTFYENTAYDFGGAAVANGDQNGNSQPLFRNCIFWGNKGEKEGDIFFKNNGQPTLEYCLVDKPDCSSLHSSFADLSEVICGEGMIYNKTPKFLDSENENLRLKSNSAGLDAGLDSFNLLSFDLDNKARISLNNIDMGAYEYDGHPPTRLESFTATSNDNFIELNWITGAEFENSGFEIQRSRDSIEWNPISWVSSKGDANRRQSYTAFDIPPERGEIYSYRLKQTDIDDCFSFFGLDTAFIRPNQVLAKLFPNPTDRQITLKIYFPKDSDRNNLKVFISNTLGQTIIKEKETKPQKGWTTFTYDLYSYSAASGIHYVSVFANNQEFQFPFLLVRY